ncbi:hypothetical protein [Blastococcus sp. Marseille-P5729]|uniref:hypothetical protein n=1 Tax=Blastococcus sp. Marseille-P5729 TaxID=2086582 RepID=UPI00131CD0B4|nr:hypothetical protein [Blastococcus sp. Marseille-P5729]
MRKLIIALRRLVIFVLALAVSIGVMQVVVSAAPPPPPAANSKPIDTTNVPPLSDSGWSPPALDPGSVGDMGNPPAESVVPVEDEPVVPKNSSGFDPAKSTISDRSLMYNVYDNPDGSKTAVQKLEPVNAPQPDGSYTPIDLALTTASASDAPSAAKASVAGADMAPSTKAKNHPLKPVFGKDASTGGRCGDLEWGECVGDAGGCPEGGGAEEGEEACWGFVGDDYVREGSSGFRRDV